MIQYNKVRCWSKSHDNMNVSIFITGLNSKLLLGELATHFTGRYISIKNAIYF